MARLAVSDNHSWYHTIDLPGGDTTPGYVDWRGHAGRILPPSMEGLRALDVGTYDGFWAFEMEKRGADVVAIDLDHLADSEWPPVHRERLLAESEALGVELGRGFRLVSERLGSSVQRVACDVGELTPEAIGGPVDVAFLGALLLHLRDPVRALENIRRTLRPNGRLLALEAISLRDTLLHPASPLARFDTARNPFNWWLPNVRALHHLVWAAGFERQRRIGFLHRPPSKPEMRSWYFAIEAFSPDA